jgi:hypothetical protein
MIVIIIVINRGVASPYMLCIMSLRSTMGSVMSPAVMKIQRPVSRDEFLRTMLTPSQRDQLERVQQALAADPTCLETPKMTDSYTKGG